MVSWRQKLPLEKQPSFLLRGGVSLPRNLELPPKQCQDPQHRNTLTHSKRKDFNSQRKRIGSQTSKDDGAQVETNVSSYPL